MFLALDLGNSALKAGLHDGARWVRTATYAHALEAMDARTWLRRFLALDLVRAAGLASVVPARAEAWAAAVRETAAVEARLVDPAAPGPLGMGYATPATLGADRWAAAVAAHALAGAGRAAVALDAGTAVTTEAVSGGGVYLGGAIAPGPDLLRAALARGTAQLPDVGFDALPPAVGADTRGAIAAGLATLFLDGTAGLVARTVAALGADGPPPLVVATGGWAPWLAAHLPPGAIDRVEPHLVLDGIRLLTDDAR